MFSYQAFKFLIFRPLVAWGFRAKVIGVDNIPPSGGAILAMNHVAAMDSVVVPAMMPRELFYPAKAELFRGKSFTGRIVAGFLKLVGMVPMERGGGRASSDSLQAVAEVLRNGKMIGIYPEGTRSADGRLYKGHTGVARLALETGVPVIPVGVSSTQAVRGWFGIPWLSKPQIVVGKPMRFPDLAPTKQQVVLRKVTNEVMAEIQHITGQEYADVYGVRVKHGDLKGADLSEFLLESPKHATGDRPRG